LKGFKFLVLGTIFAKLFGIIRELLILSKYGYSQEISAYFSVIAILSVLTIFSDISVLNSIAFPIWLKNKTIVIRYNYKVIIFFILVCSFLFCYNYFIFPSFDNTHVKIIISLIIIPLVINSILYSLLIYLDKKKEFLIVSAWNGFLYLFLTFILIDYGLVGLIYSRLFTIILTIVLTLVYVHKDVIVSFTNKKKIFTDGRFIKNSLKRFILVNSVLLFSVAMRIHSSFFFESKMALVNYSMLIGLTFYGVFSKNLNNQLIKYQIKNSVLNPHIKYLYWSLSCLFLLGLVVILFFGPNAINFLDYCIEVKEVLKLSIFLMIPIIILGYLDLLFQSKLAQPKSSSILYILPTIFSLVFYHLIMVLFFA
jgi:hypothetical protein